MSRKDNEVAINEIRGMGSKSDAPSRFCAQNASAIAAAIGTNREHRNNKGPDRCVKSKIVADVQFVPEPVRTAVSDAFGAKSASGAMTTTTAPTVAVANFCN